MYIYICILIRDDDGDDDDDDDGDDELLIAANFSFRDKIFTIPPSAPLGGSSDLVRGEHPQSIDGKTHESGTFYPGLSSFHAE